MTRSYYILVAAVLVGIVAGASCRGSCCWPGCACPGSPPGCACNGCTCEGPAFPLPAPNPWDGCQGCRGCSCDGGHGHGRSCGCSCDDGANHGHGCRGCGGCGGCGGDCGHGSQGQGCQGCDCSGCQPVSGPLGRALATPPPSVIRALIVARLASDAGIATTVCGVPALGLIEVEAEQAAGDIQVLGSGTLTVSGKPLIAPGAAGTASAPPLCSGKVHYLVAAVALGAAGATAGAAEEQLDWQLRQLELRKVTTPGVSWEPPRRSKGSHSIDWD